MQNVLPYTPEQENKENSEFLKCSFSTCVTRKE